MAIDQERQMEVVGGEGPIVGEGEGEVEVEVGEADTAGEGVIHNVGEGEEVELDVQVDEVSSKASKLTAKGHTTWYM